MFVKFLDHKILIRQNISESLIRMSGKRASDSGSSPLHKKIDFYNDAAEDQVDDWPDPSPGDPCLSPSHYHISPETPTYYMSSGNPTEQSKDSSTFSSSQLPDFSQPDLPLFQSQHSISSLVSAPSVSSSAPPPLDQSFIFNQSFNLDQSITLDQSFTSDEPDFFMNNFQYHNESSREPSEETFIEALNVSKDSLGVARAAEIILNDSDLKAELTRIIHTETHNELKRSLKKSILTANKKDRRYLLSLSPRVLCEELRDLAPQAYHVLVMGLLGVSDPAEVLESKHLTNNLAMLFSTIAKTINRKASGYGLLLTAIARDGGLREDSLKLLCNLCHPRTAQKYDKVVLANGWDTKLKEVLSSESLHFQELRNAEVQFDQLSGESSSQEQAVASAEIELLRNQLPPQVQLVWDNLNLRTRHRHERQGDNYLDSNFDWMASLWIQERVLANHMDHKPGQPLKEPTNLSIQDFVPSQLEENYIFTSLVHYYASRLTSRHPLVFKSLNSSIKV